MITKAPGSPVDTTDQSVPLPSLDEFAQRQSTDNRVTQSFDQPPDYQQLLITSGKETYPLNAQVPQFPSIAGPPHHAASTISESESCETLRELQANIVKLKAARQRASKHSKSTRSTGLRQRGADNGAHEVHVLEELVLAGMHHLSRIHPDPLVQTEWASRAENFSNSLRVSNVSGGAEGGIALSDVEAAASSDIQGARGHRFRRRAARLFVPSENDTILTGITKGFTLVLCTPVILSAAAVFGTGTILYGTGKIIVGLGHVATGGKLK